MTVVTPGPAADEPLITVTGGGDPPEIAAVLAAVSVLLAARQSAAAEPGAGAARRALWADWSRERAAFPHPGPQSWRASALPR
jgi:hypothetical protein